jgi:hypothetical protein
MSLHINKFIDRVSSHESRRQSNFSMSMTDAKNLLLDITRLLSRIEELSNKQQIDQEKITVDLSGGHFR